MSTTVVNAASMPRVAYPKGGSFVTTITFPDGTDLSGKTVYFKIVQREGDNDFDKDSGYATIGISGTVVTVNVPASATSDDDGSTLLSAVQSGQCKYRIDVLNADGSLYARFQGECIWIDEEGSFDV